MIDKLEPKKLGLLGSLYVTQFLPIAFFLQALPAFLRQSGASLATIGLIYTVALPWLFKFIWSPLIDRYGWTRWGHYRFWIICLQSLTALILVISAFLDVQNDFVVLFVCLFVIGFLAATQDIATDALAVSLLDERERKIGNGVQIAGNFLGAIVGGGGMLILLDRIGWTASVLLMALCTVLALIPTLQYEERGREKGNFIQNSKLKKSYFKTLTNFFRRPEMGGWLSIVLLYMTGSELATTMFQPLLVDIGLSIAQIGWLMGVAGLCAGLVGGLVGGLSIQPLGRKRSLMLFGLLQAIAVATYIIPAIGVTSLPVLYAIAIGFRFTNGLAITALSPVMMDKSEPQTAGTDYTIQNSISAIGSRGASAFSGFIAGAIGYVGFFIVCIALSLFGVAIVVKVFQASNRQTTVTTNTR